MVRNKNNGTLKIYEIPMVRCRKEWFEGTDHHDNRLCPDLDNIPKDLWIVKGKYDSNDERISIST